VSSPRIQPEFRWPHFVDGPFTIRLHWQKIAGREECVGFEMWRGTPPTPDGEVSPDGLPFGPLRAGDIRKPNFGDLVDQSRRDAVRRAQATLDSEIPSPFQPALEDNQPLSPEVRLYLQERVASFGDGAPIGRPPQYGREHFEAVADVYRQAWSTTGKPLVAITERWPGTSKSAAAKWVAKCREMELLPKTGRGIAKIEEES
jgi:hypothetical protein